MPVSRIGRLALTFCCVWASSSSLLVQRSWAFAGVLVVAPSSFRVEQQHPCRRQQHYQHQHQHQHHQHHQHQHRNTEFYSSTRASEDRIATDNTSSDHGKNNNGGIPPMDDATLLRQVTRAQLVRLCESCRLVPVEPAASKAALLRQLRDHAAEEAAAARDRLAQRRRRVEQQGDAGGGGSKERYELLDDDDDGSSSISGSVEDDEEEGFFFYAAPEGESNSNNNNSNNSNKNESPKKKKKATVLDRSTVTAPPLPPDAPVDKDGQRSVTIYSTTEQNDLTAIAASQPGQQNRLDALSSSSNNNSQQPQPWDMEGQAASRSQTSERALERATEQVVELVSHLLALSGAPAFCLNDDALDDDDEGNDDDADSTYFGAPQSQQKQRQHSFVGFTPSAVPADWLARASTALRAGRGRVLQDALRKFELRAIGQDGAAADDRDRGGGHYAEVSKVGAFLEGYRRAEVRRVARETATQLLDRLCGEGVDGLDLALSAMVRSGDDTGAEAGVELDDSLVDFLNDAIRQQEKRVDELVAARLDSDDTNKRSEANNHDADHGDEDEDDPTQQLWNVTVEDGMRVETLDPNDPQVRRVLEEEAAKSDAAAAVAGTVTAATPIPETAPEKLLLLLTLLRERIKAEAAFGPDEKGRNLRLLAYCLRVSSDKEREQLILNAVGNSLDRLDSFAELTESSIEYGESTSYGLQPAKTQFLNVLQLKQILELTRDLRERQTFKAAGLRPYSNS